MCQFYYPNGEQITQPNATKKFVEFYNQCYYLENSPLKEAEIESILNKNIPLETGDIAKILEWKTGGQYKRSENIVQYRYGKISIEKIEKVIGQKRGALENEEAQNILKNLCAIDGMGIVYAISFLYFITNGKQYPIYDKYAHISLLAILSKDNNHERKYGGIELITDKVCNQYIKKDKIKNGRIDVNTIFGQYIKNYVILINQIFSQDFGCNYGEIKEENANRDIDRALWSYGHLFNDNQKNKEKRDYD